MLVVVMVEVLTYWRMTSGECPISLPMLFMLKSVSKSHKLYTRDQLHEVVTPGIFVVKGIPVPFLTVLPCAICIFQGRTDTRVYLHIEIVNVTMNNQNHVHLEEIGLTPPSASQQQR